MSPPPPKENPVQPASIEQGLQDKNLTSFKERVKRNHTRVKATRQVVEAMEQLPLARWQMPLSRIRQCSDYLQFRNYYRIGKIKLSGANFCKVHQVCSQCAQRRATQYATQIVESIQASYNPDHHYQLITLTVRNGNDLDETLARLFRFFKILLNRYMRKNKSDSIANVMLGGVWTIEITNNGKGWHPHIHGLIVSSSPITTKQVRREWEDISGGDSYICDSTRIDHTDKDKLWASIAEVSKYTLKNLELTPEQLLQVYLALKNKQLIRRFGILSSRKINMIDIADYANEPFVAYLLKYFASGYKLENAEAYENEADYNSRNPKASDEA
jgi:plasmid rolling circle replication initiator protein Rep